MAPILYHFPASPGVRSVLMAAKAIGLHLDMKEINLLAGDQLQPEYLKMNPQHTVPTLKDDDGFSIWDSHAIITYIVSKYGKDDSLYPKDLQKRAIIDQRLHFDSSVAFGLLAKIMVPLWFRLKKTIDDEDKEAVNTRVYTILEAFLDGRQWMAGDSVTVADYSLIATISSFNTIVLPIDGKKFPKLAGWLKRAEQLPEYAVNAPGLKQYDDAVKALMK